MQGTAVLSGPGELDWSEPKTTNNLHAMAKVEEDTEQPVVEEEAGGAGERARAICRLWPWLLAGVRVPAADGRGSWVYIYIGTVA